MRSPEALKVSLRGLATWIAFWWVGASAALCVASSAGGSVSDRGRAWDIAITQEGLVRFALMPATPGVETLILQKDFELLATASFGSWAFGGRAVKIYVQEKGIYRVPADLILKVDNRWLGSRVEDLRLFCLGRAVPIWVEDVGGDGFLDPEDAIEFWGEPYRPDPKSTPPDRYWDPYTRTNVYWLTISASLDGSWMVPLQGSVGRGDLPLATWGYREVHVEEDRVFARLGRVPYPADRDHWFWGKIPGSTLTEFSFDLGAPDTMSYAQVRLRVCLSGRTYEELGDHQAQVFLGKRKVGSPLYWRDQDYVIAEFGPDDGVSPACLVQGMNSIGILNLSPDETNEILFNWAELKYPQRYEAGNGVLEFESPPEPFRGRVRFRLRGFSSPAVDVYKIGVGKFVGCETEYSDEEGYWEVLFEDVVESEGAAYVAIESDRKLKPVAVRAEKASFWSLDQAEGYDYVIIGPDSLLRSRALDSLVTLRESSGLTVARVDVEDLYDEFAYGIHTPVAIRRFLQHAQEAWSHPPRYVLLLGRAAGSREIFGNRRCLVPSLWAQTVKYGATLSDNLFAAGTVDHPVPKLAIGRLPVSNLSELTTVVRKMWQFERAPVGDWMNRVLMISGLGTTFRQQVTDLTHDRLDWAWELQRLDVGNPETEFSGGTPELLDTWNAGLSVVHFLGHGGGRIWSDARLMTFDDVPELRNGARLPFVASWTCFTAAMDGSNSLGVELLLHPEGGAVAVLGSAGLGWVWNDYYLLSELLAAFEDTSVTTIGEAIELAKRSYFARYPTSLGKTQVNQFTLLGDPATPIRLVRQKLRLTAREGGGSSYSLQVEGTNRLSGLETKVHAFDPACPARSVQLESKWQEGQLSVRVPSGIGAGDSLAFRVFCWDPGSGFAAHGTARPELRDIVVDSVWWSPERPRIGSDLWLFLSAPASETARFWARLLRSGEQVELIPVRDGVWRTPQAIRPETVGKLRMEVGVQGPGRDIVWARLIEIPVLDRLGFWIEKGSLELVWKAGQPRLSCEVSSDIRQQETECEVRFLISLRDTGSWELAGCDTVVVPPGKTGTAEVPFSPPGRDFWLRVECRRLGSTDYYIVWKRMEGGYFVVTPLGEIRVGADEAKKMEFGPFALEPHSVGEDSVDVHYRLLPPDSLSVDVEAQPDFSPLEDQSVVGMVLSSLSGSPVSFDIDWVGRASVADDNLRICVLDTDGLWRVLGRKRGAELILRPGHSATIGMLKVADTDPPAVRFEVNGRPLPDGGLLSPEDELVIRITDRNGVPGWLALQHVLLDGRDYSERARLVSADQSETVWKVCGGWPAGEHEIGILAMDRAANSSMANIRVQVHSQQKLTVLGTYPNPFRDETVLVYELARRADRIHIEIFSGSGLRVRTLAPRDSRDPDLLAAGYHEVVWDATDDDGRTVGYGIYFYRIAVLTAGKWYEQLGKIARVP